MVLTVLRNIYIVCYNILGRGSDDTCHGVDGSGCCFDTFV